MRFFSYTLFPLICAYAFLIGNIKRDDKALRTEVFLIFLLGIGVAGNGISNFFSHFFLSDIVAKSIGWETGSPFQKEVAFSNLAMGILGIIAIGRRDGFRLATIIAVSVFSFGATIIHIIDMAETGNFAPGNSIQNFSNILKPLILIFLYRKSAYEVQEEDSRYLRRTGIIAGILAMIIASALSVTFTLGYPFLIIGGISLLSWTILFFDQKSKRL